jgi:mRNA-degrading endonuclease RelE of RelBE toxin-antitoxin system
MENTIYIAKAFGESLKTRPDPERQQIEDMIDSLAGDGWKDSEIASADGSLGGGLRARRSGNLSLLFRYAPEQHAIIVANVMPAADYELATKA